MQSIPIHEQLKQDLDAIVKKATIGKKVCCMLSGGVDSFVITHLANKYAKKIIAVTVTNGVDGQDVIWAKKCVDVLKIPFKVITFNAQDAYDTTREFLKRFPDTRTIVRLQCGLVTEKCASYAKSESYDTLLCGDGADAVFGSTGHMRRKSKRPDFNAIKRAVCEKGIAEGVGHDFVAICSYYGLNSAIPYRDTNFIDNYVDLDDKIINKPKEKQILRSAFESELPRDLVYRERLTLQDGVGIKHKHIELLRSSSPKNYKSPKYIIKEIINDLQSHQFVFKMRRVWEK